MRTVTATAAPNFALAKYWGKSDDAAMIPAVPSLSITLDGPLVTVTVAPSGGTGDEVLLDGQAVPETWRARTGRFLDIVRERASASGYARIETRGGPRPATGLASSAAYFAALAQAASRAWDLPLDPDSISDLARMGSVSAARSVPGGWVLLDPRSHAGGPLCARTVFPPSHWAVRIVIAVVSPGPKAVGSSEGMRRTRETSPFWDGWVRSTGEDLEEIRRAIEAREMDALGRAARRSALRMHASAMASDPPILYWEPATLAVMREVDRLATGGVPCFYTVDAGSQVKVICLEEDAEAVRQGIDAIPGVVETLVRAPGPGSLFGTGD